MADSSVISRGLIPCYVAAEGLLPISAEDGTRTPVVLQSRRGLPISFASYFSMCLRVGCRRVVVPLCMITREWKRKEMLAVLQLTIVCERYKPSLFVPFGT